jgi:hypothetical protein
LRTAVDDPAPPTEAARFLVLVVGLVCVALAGVVYTIGTAGYLLGVAILLGIAAIYIGLFIFASTKTCQSSLWFLTLGGMAWWD